MIERRQLEEQCGFTLQSLDLPEFGNSYRGKVRDCYVVGDRRILITSDRLSAFDRVLTTIPFKGKLLNEMAAYWFGETSHIIPNHIIEHPHPNVFLARECQILPVEVVVRGYLAGSAWRDYQAGRAVSGVELASGMRRSQRFDKPLITPSTKAEMGVHDEPISSEEVVRSGMVQAKLWQQICETAIRLFEHGTLKAKERGLILVDTKYEFGVIKTANSGQELILADEIHTQDSSRYWMLSSYMERFEAGEDPEMLDKEFVRRWLIEQGYMGEGEPPVFTDAFRVDTAIRYIEAYEQITGQVFKGAVGSPAEEIKAVVRSLKLPGKKSCCCCCG